MKKILVLFVLALGFASFANNRLIAEWNLYTNVTLCDENLVILKNVDESKTSEFKTEVSVQMQQCTATVYYNGEIVASFSVDIIHPSYTAMACSMASAQACQYIVNHGGVCP